MEFKDKEPISEQLSRYIVDAHITDAYILEVSVKCTVSPNTVKNLYKRKTRIDKDRGDFKTQKKIIKLLVKEAIKVHNRLKLNSTEALEYLERV